MSLNSLGPSNGMPSSRMTHSLSTPSGVDGSTSTSPHTRGGGKKLAVRVQMLDDSMTMFQVQVLYQQPRNPSYSIAQNTVSIAVCRRLEVNDFTRSIYFQTSFRAKLDQVKRFLSEGFN